MYPSLYKQLVKPIFSCERIRIGILKFLIYEAAIVNPINMSFIQVSR